MQTVTKSKTFQTQVYQGREIQNFFENNDI